MKAKRILILVLIATICKGTAAQAAEAIQTPLHIGNINPIYDEAGQMLRGTCPVAASYGLPVVTGEVVQILQANAGIFPPDVNGTPHPANVVIQTTAIGYGADPAAGTTGLFALSLPERGSGQIFVRVFNRCTLTGSSFYGDSQIFTIPGFGQSYAVFVPDIPATSIPLDMADDDGDGVHNSWEESLGSNSGSTDSDGDGMLDGAEFRAGTKLTDADSLLHMVKLIPAGGYDLLVRWDSAVGKAYQVEFTNDDLNNNPAYLNVSAIVTATGLVAETTIANALLNEGGYYRVRLSE